MDLELSEFLNLSQIFFIWIWLSTNHTDAFTLQVLNTNTLKRLNMDNLGPIKYFISFNTHVHISPTYTGLSNCVEINEWLYVNSIRAPPACKVRSIK